MTLRISGTRVDVSSALRERVESRIEAAVTKYFDGGHSGHVNFSKQGKFFRCECQLHLDSGADLGGKAEDPDAYRCFDQAADRVEKRLRRYKRKLRDHHAHDRASQPTAPHYTIEAPDYDEEDVSADQAPIIIAETPSAVRTMTVSMAMMDLDLRDATVLMFYNAAHGGLNVVYRRPDGNIGWIDPDATDREN